MKVTDLTTANNKNMPIIGMFYLNGDLVIKKEASILTAKECILIDRSQEYIFESIKYTLDVMYFKFNNEDSNCIVLGYFNDGTLAK